MPDSLHREVAAHPLHTILAAYPIAFFSGALVTDLVYAQTYEMQWANFSVWMIAAGLLMGALAAVVGIVDALRSRRRDRPRPGRFHSIGVIVTWILELVNAFVHSRDAYTSVVPTGLTLSVIATILVLVTSWVGALPADRRPVESN